jgi:hypothetical protein
MFNDFPHSDQVIVATGSVDARQAGIGEAASKDLSTESDHSLIDLNTLGVPSDSGGLFDEETGSRANVEQARARTGQRKSPKAIEKESPVVACLG